jgi:hypothetical protein
MAMKGREPINVIGWYTEDRPGGRMAIVLVQPGDDREEAVEHVAETPKELWAAFEAIANDPDVPDPEVQTINGDGEDYDGDELEHASAADHDIAGLAIDACEGFVTQSGGPLLGRLIGGALRNPQRALDILRSISRKDRR